MTTVAQLIEWLKAMPQEAAVEMHSEDDRQFSEPESVSVASANVVVIWGT